MDEATDTYDRQIGTTPMDTLRLQKPIPHGSAPFGPGIGWLEPDNDRSLVYLWLDDGRFFNAMLVREGFAQPLTIPPNVQFADRFVRDARAARRAERGLWRAC